MSDIEVHRAIEPVPSEFLDLPESLAKPEGNEQALCESTGSVALALIPEQAQKMLMRMFVDPNRLEKAERAELAGQLREVVAENPEVPELRVLLGMALCVNFEVPDAIEELREGVRLDPNSFIAQLKMGELWMRLRVIGKAEEHTTLAAKLAANRVQAELARRQAASLRAIKHSGIERGYQSSGYRSAWALLARHVRRLLKREPAEESAETSVALDLS
jgi:hypothetical protein